MEDEIEQLDNENFLDNDNKNTSIKKRRRLFFVEGELLCHTGFAGVNRKMFLELYARGEWLVVARGDTKTLKKDEKSIELLVTYSLHLRANSSYNNFYNSLQNVSSN
jgi:hypothetical protein